MNTQVANTQDPSQPDAQVGAVEKKARTLFVQDSNAKPGTVRQHEVILSMDVVKDPETGEEHKEVTDSTFYNLARAEKCEMPEAHALQFLKDKAFIVTNHKGDRLEPVSVKDTDVGKIVLEEDELVAKYHELTQEALYQRCMIIPGATNIKKNTKKNDMVVFLMNHEAERKQAGVARGSEDVISEMGNLDSLIDLGGGSSGVDPSKIVKGGGSANKSAIAQVAS